MSKAPIDVMLDGLEWTALPPKEPGDVPHATHQGVLTLFGVTLRCYTLSNGLRVFDADDIEAWVKGGAAPR